MTKTIKDGYIIAFAKDGDVDYDYERLKEIFDNHGEADEGMTWAMKEDETMVQINLPVTEPDVPIETVVSEINKLLEVG